MVASRSELLEVLISRVTRGIVRSISEVLREVFEVWVVFQGDEGMS